MQAKKVTFAVITGRRPTPLSYNTPLTLKKAQRRQKYKASYRASLKELSRLKKNNNKGPKQKKSKSDFLRRNSFFDLKFVKHFSKESINSVSNGLFSLQNSQTYLAIWSYKIFLF